MQGFMKHLIFLSLCFAHLSADWQNTGIVSPTNSDASNGLDGSGNATVIWTDWNTNTNHIYSSYLPKGENGYWQAVNTVFSAPHHLFYYPNVAIDSMGNAVAIWQDSDRPTSKISASMRPFQGHWSTPVDLTDTTMGLGTAPQIAINASGYAVAIWRLNSAVQAATLQFGGNWSTPVNLGTSSLMPHVKVDSAGNALAVWSDNGVIQSAFLPHGGTWSSGTSLSTKNALEPRLAINDSGYAALSWVESPNSIYAATLEFGKGWSQPLLIGSAGLIGNSAVAVDLDGNAIVLWMQQDVENTPSFPIISPPYLQATYFSHQHQHWTQPVTISAKEDGAYNPKVTFDGSGHAFAIWNTYSTVQVALFSPVKMSPNMRRWASPTTLRDGLYGLATKPQICVDSSGYAVANWSNELGVIESARMVPD